MRCTTRTATSVEDDPGTIEFLVDGKQVLTEINPPFGDSFADGSITVSNGQHTFQVRALNDSGTLLATNTVTATVNNQTHATTAADRPVTRPLRRSPATCASPRPPQRASRSPGTPPPTTSASPATTSTAPPPRSASSTTATSYTINGLTCGTAYSVGVRALDTAGNTSPQANDVGHHVRLRRHPAAHRAEQRHRLDTHHHQHRPHLGGRRPTTSASPATASTTAAELVNTTAGTTGIVSGLTCGTNYTLAVDAFDATGNSSPKTTVMVSTLPCADTTPPTVTMTSPTNGSTMTGTINASANATDNVGVTRVDFFRDGVSSGSDTSSPYTIPVNTTTIANGSHTFGARAYDTAGNVGNATNVTVTVSNTTRATQHHRPARCPPTRTPAAPACRPGRRSRRAAA